MPGRCRRRSCCSCPASVRAAAVAPVSASRCVHELGGVGENLQDHLQARVIFQCTLPITHQRRSQSWWRMMKMGVEYVVTRGGPMAIGINQGGIFAAGGRRAPRLLTCSSTSRRCRPTWQALPTHPFSGFTMSVCQLRPESRGHVRIQSSRSARAAGDAAELSVDARTTAARWSPGSGSRAGSPLRGRSRPT